jgi:hypothetical protein
MFPKKPESETAHAPPKRDCWTRSLVNLRSLLLALKDRNVLPEREILGILQDAADAHTDATLEEDAECQAAVANLINGVHAGRNSVRRK